MSTDSFADASLLATARAAILAAAANTEVVVFSTKIATTDPAKSCPHYEAAMLGVFADQALTIFHRCRSVQSVEVVEANKWRNAAVINGATGAVTYSGQALDVNVMNSAIADFFGDDHQLVLKTGATPPTKVELTLRFRRHT